MQVPVKLVPFVLLASLAAAAGGCKKKPPPPTTLTYELHSKDFSLEGATATLAGKTGTFQKQTWSSYTDIVAAKIEVPIGTPNPSAGSIAIELPTPCGTKTTPLKFTPNPADEARARDPESHYSMVFLDVTPADSLPPSAVIWVDADGSDKVDIGTVKAGRGMTRLYDYECTTPVTIRAGSRDLGEMPTFNAGLKTHGVFVTTKPGTCYSYEGVVYSTTPGGGGHRSIFRDKNVYGLTDEKVDYFLTQAPSSKSGNFSFVYELVSIPCGGGAGTTRGGR